MSGLEITDVNLYQAENAVSHHTDQFYVVYQKPGEGVVRRGQIFRISFTADRQFDKDADNVRFVFSLGNDPVPFQSTQGVAVLSKEWEEGQTVSWAGRVVSLSEEGARVRHTVDVVSPAHTPVGLWRVRCESVFGGKTSAFEHPSGLYILFNPWCKDDAVYMPEEQLLDEYVLNDSGKIWKGSYNTCLGRPWVFGQFHKKVLPACMLILERTGLHPMVRGDPVKMARALSKLINSNDDQGVLTGKWSEPYAGGTPPSAWTGSVPILKQYLETGREVRYGQCWVFAGVLTTVCRALGLPSRVVSNLESAHDSNASLSIDRYYDSELKPITRGVPNDSIWNFHVWNDVWMTRYDLPAGYGGWQAVDSTPQETSEGVFQCGPASVRAIRTGAIGHPYDAAFVYASVNADIIRWKEDKHSDLGFIRIQTVKDQVGKMILTKKPFVFDCNADRDREDITEQYKPKEGSEMERMVVMNAAQRSERAKRYYGIKEGQADVQFELQELEKILIGEDYRVAVVVQERTIKAVLSSTSIFYTGIAANEIKKIGTQFVMRPKSREEISITVPAAEYSTKLVEYGIMKINVIANVAETNQTWADEDDFQVIKPAVNIEVKGQLQVGKECTAELAVLNPTRDPVTKGSFHYECAGLIKAKKAKVKEIPTRDLGRASVTFVPKRAGSFRLVAVFSSKELSDMTGTKELIVERGENQPEHHRSSFFRFK